MITMFGEYALSGAMLTTMMILLAVFAYARSGNDGLLRCVRWGLALIALLLCVSVWGLLKALLDDNFSLSYVVEHSERALGFGYKVAAFWAGQQGSLLFWAWVLGLMGLVMAWRLRHENNAETAATLAVMAAVTGFFTCVMIFVGNPFEHSKMLALDGEGLNPALQNLAMVFHPPMLFLGYAGFTAPFAFMLGALITGRRESQWISHARPWMVYSWIMLTVGIVLGAQWAYVELGWGGYWAWDPVENASLLPWLTGTALLHSVMLQAGRGMFKRWTASLVAATFFLCVFGTYLTRSGVIHSVHSFQESPIGGFFLAFLALIGIVSTVTILIRLGLLESKTPLADLFSREGFFLAANVLLVLMMLATLIGTIFPLISSAFSATPITVAAPFYNKVILPMALVVALLMSTGPILGSGIGAALRAKPQLIAMAVVAVLAAVAIAFTGHTSIWALSVAAIAASVVAGVVIDLMQTLLSALRTRNGRGLSAFVAIFARRRRHWGAQLAHLGLAAIIVGIAGSSLYGITRDVTLSKDAGSVAQVGPYTLGLRGFEQVTRPNHKAVVAIIDVTRDGRTFQLKPERRFYARGTDPNQSASEVAIRFGLGEDVYLNLAGWEDNGSSVAIQAIINPLVNWIWIGGALMTLGGLICLIPQQKRAAIAVAERLPTSLPLHQNAAHTARDRQRTKLTPSFNGGKQ